MKVILHIGAHRTGTTTLQDYLRRNGAALAARGLATWGPDLTRKGLFAGVQPVPGLGRNAAGRARGRIALRMDAARRRGAKALLVSDENMMGTVRRNLRARALYHDVGERLARLIWAFDGGVDEVVVNIRSLEHFWASAVAYGVARGHPLPDAADLACIAGARRSWIDVISDIACAAPRARLRVLPFERFAGRPEAALRAVTGLDCPTDPAPAWLNRAPGCDALRAIISERGGDPDPVPPGPERFQPFGPTALAALREAYADDMHWLIAGANGLATLTEDTDRRSAGTNPPAGHDDRGHSHDIEKGRLAHSGRR